MYDRSSTATEEGFVLLAKKGQDLDERNTLGGEISKIVLKKKRAPDTRKKNGTPSKDTGIDHSKI